MREIKFRAWDRETKKWTTSGYWISTTTQRLECIPQLEVTQFTGLHDKNGKEIYEGDIVQYFYNLDLATQKFYGVIEFQDMNIEIGYEHDETRFVGFVLHAELNKNGGYFTPIPSTSLVSFLEVIGNIYENPELLEEK